MQKKIIPNNKLKISLLNTMNFEKKGIAAKILHNHSTKQSDKLCLR